MFLNSLRDFENGRLIILGECIDINKDKESVRIRLAKGTIEVLTKNIKHFELHRFYGISGLKKGSYLIENQLFETTPDFDFDLCVDMVENFNSTTLNNF